MNNVTPFDKPFTPSPIIPVYCIMRVFAGNIKMWCSLETSWWGTCRLILYNLFWEKIILSLRWLVKGCTGLPFQYFYSAFFYTLYQFFSSNFFHEWLLRLGLYLTNTPITNILTKLVENFFLVKWLPTTVDLEQKYNSDY